MPAEVAERVPGRSGVRARQAGQDRILRSDKKGANVDHDGVVRIKCVESPSRDRSGPDGVLVDLDRGR